MRIDRIELARYGHFTNYSIDFGTPSANSDFHIIFGLNESGKSTIRDACIDYMFGFEHSTKYNFKHPNDTLLIGAEITANSQQISGQRIKRTKEDFRNAAGETISDAALKAALGDVTRATFEQMFSLDDATLVDGGNEILKSQGDLGALLFSAASGLSFVSASLDKVSLEASSFFKQTGRKYRLIEYKKQLDVLKGRLKEIDLQAGAYERLHKQAENAELRYCEVKTKREADAGRQQELRSLLEAFEIYVDYSEVLTNLGPLEDAPDVPQGRAEEANQLVQEIKTRTSLLEENEKTIVRLQNDSDRIQLDPVALKNAAAVNRLSSGDLESRHRGSIDIQHRERDVDNCEGEIKDLLRALGQSNCDSPRSLLLPASILANARDLISQQAEILTNQKSSKKELDDAKENQRVKAKHFDRIKIPFDLVKISDFLNSNQRLLNNEIDDLQSQNIAVEEQALNEAMDALLPWQGTCKDLIKMNLPVQSDLTNLGRQVDALNNEQTELAVEASHLNKSIDVSGAEIEALNSAAGLIDDQSASAARKKRNDAWNQHVAVFHTDLAKISETLQTTAAQFEQAQGEDDASTTQRIMQGSELASFRQAQLLLAKNKALLEKNEKRQATQKQKITEAKNEVSSLMFGLGLPQSMGIDFLSAWLGKRDVAVGRIRALTSVKEEADRRQKSKAHAQSVLERLMQAANISFAEEPEAFDNRFAKCKRAVGNWENDVRQRKIASDALAESNISLGRRQEQYDRVSDAQFAWQKEWDQILANTWMKDVRPNEVEANIDLLAKLDAKITSLDEIHQRIEKMKIDRKAYAIEIDRLTSLLEMSDQLSVDETDPLQIADKLRERIAHAELIQRDLVKSLDAVAEQKLKRDETQDTLNVAKAKELALCELMNVADCEDLLGQIKRGEQKTILQMQLSKLGSIIQKILSIADLDSAVKKLQSHCATDSQVEELRREQAALLRESDVESEHVLKLYQEWKDAERVLADVGEDGEVARLEEERAVLLLQIEQEAHDYMRLTAGTLMVGEALRTYRDTHRSSMMRHASDAFVQITRGAFSGLTSTPGKNGDILVGTRSDGSSIEVHQMSKGTCFQLYLALRIAGYAEFAKQRETLPFFADDILEPFDNARSAETFQLFQEMSKQGQVIYLTHHEHLCDIATQVCGNGVRIHNLPDAALSTKV